MAPRSWPLQHRARLQAGETLLVLGAAGGVGLTAVELGAWMGARVIAAASTAEKLALAREYGASAGINYCEEELRERVLELTEGRGADVIYDPVGGDLFDQAVRCIAWEGRYLVVGFASGRIPNLPANRALLKNMALVGVFWGAYLERDPQIVHGGLRTLFAATDGRATPPTHLARISSGKSRHCADRIGGATRARQIDPHHGLTGTRWPSSGCNWTCQTWRVPAPFMRGPLGLKPFTRCNGV